MAFWYDFAMLVVWPIVALYNRQAFLMYFLLVYYTFLFYSFDTNFKIFCFAAFACFIASVSQLKLLSDFRKAIFILGMLYYASAIDELLFYHFNVNTYLIYIRFWFIAFTHICIIIILTGGKSGRKSIGMARILANSRLYAISLLQTIKKLTPAGKRT